MFSVSDINLKVLFIICGVFGYILYILRRKYSHWKDIGVPYIGFPRDFLFLASRKHLSIVVRDAYNQLSPHAVGGIFQATQPILLIRDPELVRSILIKDFSSFTDRNTLQIDEKLDPLNTNIFSLHGQRWKSIRNKLLPTFSSSKLRSMYLLLDECSNELHDYLHRTLKKSSELNVRELMIKFAADVIGSCAFGLDFNAINDEESDFLKIRRLFTPKSKILLRSALRAIHPNLTNWLRLKGFHPEVENFFFTLTRESIKNRAENEVKRNDFMQLLINVQREEKEMLESSNDKSEPLFVEHVLAANIFVFYFAGFDTTATTLSYCLYELALHPDIMERLHDEIKKVENAHGGKLNFDSYKEMQYMDCIVSETLRKHPVLCILERFCNNTYRVSNSSLVIQKGTKVIIPVSGLHHDPQYFPEPEKFDPERFNDENKLKIVPGTYLPFGDGPRICIGMRFALVEVKAALAKIIGNYTVHPTERTEIPITLNSKALILNTPNSIYLRFQNRD